MCSAPSLPSVGTRLRKWGHVVGRHGKIGVADRPATMRGPHGRHRRRIAVILVGLLAAIGATQLHPLAASAASRTTIKFTFVPPYGSFEDLRGVLGKAAPSAHRVAVYIKVGGGWWTKPYWSYPTTSISTGGSFVTDITNGGTDQNATQIAAYLIRSDYQPPLASGHAAIPGDIEAQALAKVVADRTP